MANGDPKGPEQGVLNIRSLRRLFQPASFLRQRDHRQRGVRWCTWSHRITAQRPLTAALRG